MKEILEEKERLKRERDQEKTKREEMANMIKNLQSKVMVGEQD